MNYSNNYFMYRFLIVFPMLLYSLCDARQPVGLVSLGNSCYMNAMIQVLHSIDPLSQALKTIYYDANKYPLASNYQYIVKLLLESNSAKVSSENLWKILSTKMSAEHGRQEDITEAVDKLFQELSSNKTIQNTIEHNLGCVIGQSSNSSAYIFAAAVREESNKIIALDNLDDVLYWFMAKYNTENNNMFVEQFSHISDYFMIGIKRSLSQTIKANHAIDIPSRLNIKDYLAPNLQEDPLRGYWYKLQAVGVHLGNSAQQGHYTAYINNNGTWYDCNDNKVNIVSEKNVLKNIKAEAYLLVYKKENIHQEFIKPIAEVNSKKNALTYALKLLEQNLISLQIATTRR